MKKILIILLLTVILSSCRDAGTKYEGYSYCVMDKDTIDFVMFYPNGGLTGVWVGKTRNSNNKTISLTYPVGKTQESVIIVNTNEIKIKGTVLLENDSIIIIKKK